MTTKPRALILTAAGINCDQELAHAFASAGAAPEYVHVNQLIADPSLIQKYQLIGLPGGFSFGDAVAAGRILAQLIRRHLYGALVEAVERGVPIFAPCNGFQIAVQVGLLPGPALGEPWPSTPGKAEVTLAVNQSASFVDQWSRMTVPDNQRCIWTQNLEFDDVTGVLPSAHGEGRFLAASQDVIDGLRDNGQVALCYHQEDNFNGSAGAIAGICDASGLVFGLMPHPERYTDWSQHPYWTRLDAGHKQGETPGLQMFRQAVRHAAAVFA